MYDEGDDIRPSGSHIVLHDPNGKYWPGVIVDLERATMLKGQNVALLPVEPKMFAMGAIAGYHKREWGSGYPLGHDTPRLNSPLCMLISQRFRTVNWAARLVRDRRYPADLPLRGTLRLSTDSSQSWANSGVTMYAQGQTVKDMKDLGRPDDADGWTIYGSNIITAPRDGFAGFALYGHVHGLAIAWAAVTQTP